MFRLLGVETRHRILELLRAGELPVGEIARKVGVTQPAASQHLRALRDAGLVADRREGQFVYYRLDAEASARYGFFGRAMGWSGRRRMAKAELEAYERFLRDELSRVERELDREEDG